ncbi:MAG: proprotein convertase P-domain-containing protein, partial [Deltaproteobacteria bacterium]|nr:proprotein convertase P-domain-containing protein [Deltaproteobacteria bacterium]
NNSIAAYNYEWLFGSVRHLGESSKGTWRLTVRDLATGDTGTFQSWTLRIFGIPTPVTHIITASNGGNGTISPSGTVSVSGGENQTFTINPDTEYCIADVLVDGISVGAVSSYTFSNITSDHTIYASFCICHTITATAAAGGTISPSGATLVCFGESAAYTITPNYGYRITDVTVDGVSVGVVSSYTFTNVTADHTIDASFMKDRIVTYVIAATAGTGGTISPVGDVTVNVGSNQTFTIAAQAGFVIDDVIVDGASVGSPGSYTFTGVMKDHTIEAFFKEMVIYPITATALEGGTITPSGEVNVNEGDDITFTITPDTGYNIIDVLIDGTTVGIVTTYTFQNVESAHTIEAWFASGTIYVITASSSPGGTITPEGALNVEEGFDTAFTIKPEEGYIVEDVLVDGVSAGAVTSYTFSDVNSDHAIEALFKEVPSSDGSGGNGGGGGGCFIDTMSQ